MNDLEKKEYFCNALKNNVGDFKEIYSLYSSEVDNNYNLCSYNSFYKPKRNQYNLHKLYYLFLDLDGWSYELPVSLLDILNKFRELGFYNPPTQIIRTSKGRFHILLQLEPLNAFSDNISYWKKCSRGLCKAFVDLGADYSASTNPAGFYRVPGHINEDCSYGTEIQQVFHSESIFRLDEIHEVLIENGLVIKSKTKKNVKAMIKRIEQGVPKGVRNKSCFSLAICYKDEGFSYEETLTWLFERNTNSNPIPMKDKEVLGCVKSAFKNSYKPSEWYLKK